MMSKLKGIFRFLEVGIFDTDSPFCNYSEEIQAKLLQTSLCLEIKRGVPLKLERWFLAEIGEGSVLRALPSFFMRFITILDYFIVI